MIRTLSCLCLATTAITLVATHASAQMAYPAPVAQPQTYANYQSQFHQDNWPNWYIGLSGQVSFVGDATVKGASNGKLSFDTGHGYTAALGYRPYSTDTLLDNMRFEVEGEYLDANFDTFGGVPIDNNLTGYGLMVNAFYDIVTGTQLTPYVGAGAGMMWWDFDSPALATDDVDGVYAYQLMTGVYYSPESIPNTDWGLGYRYLGTADPEFTSNLGTKIKHDYSSHNVELQARFRF